LLGYVSQTVAVTGTTDLILRLQPTVLPLQNMLVTASRIREVPFSASYAHIPQHSIQERYTVQDIPVLLSELPSTTYYSESGNGIGYTYLNIRGFDQRRISVMVNGVPQNDPEDHMVYWLDFPDLAANLENIQVQRGAGNPWGGTPSIGGAINLVSSNFTRQKGISLSTGAGSYDTRKYSLAAASGLIDNHYSIYARLSKMTSDGYRENSWIDFNSYFLGVARFDGDMTTQINLYGGPVADHLAYYGVEKSALSDRSRRRFNPIQRKEEIENFSQPHYEVINEWKRGNWTVQNTLFYVLGNGFYDYDGSWAPYSYFRLSRENGFAIEGHPEELYIPDALIHAVVENKQGGWLPRLLWHSGRHTVTMGGEVRQHRSYHYGSLKWGQALPIGVTPNYHYYEYRGAKSMQSVFVNELFRAGDRWTLMGDAVLVHHTYKLYDEKYIGTDFKVPYVFFNPKVGASFQVNSGL
jgi:iron complex outermembrane receptor protein